MKLRNKSQLLIGISTLTMTLLLAVISLLAYRSYFMGSIHDQGRMAAEMIRLTVTHEMSEGNPEHKEPYLDSLVDIFGLTHAHVIPASSVIEQYGIDMNSRAPVTAAEENVVLTGGEFEELVINDDVLFRFALPYLATRNGDADCLNCHAGKEGDVLGAVSLKMDVTEQYYDAIRNTIGIVAVLIAFGFMLGFALRRLLGPIEQTTEELHLAVTAAEQGDFSRRIIKHSNDEVGDIADRANHFLGILENSIGSIAKEVDDLVGHHQARENKNLLDTTVSVVHTMALASHFKHIIENDRDLNEVYHRFQHMLDEQFSLKSYSFYEVSNSRNRLALIFNSGLPSGEELWCSKEITVNCDFCRAKRTAQIISSLEESEICNSFVGNNFQQDDTMFHICVPMILSGSVGGILQLVGDQVSMQQLAAKMPTLRKFLDEAAPVVEAKRLMQSLKDSSMRDPMTGLYNRRFLEEHLVTLTAGIKRRESQVGVLMCDIDFFKQVNDTLGHDVGDDILKGTCAIIKQAVRESDLLIRYGGEEFLILLVDTDEKGAFEVAERIRSDMESHKFKTPEGPLHKTLSLGLSMYPTDDEDFWGSVKLADIALYQAKDTGRNKVLRYSKEMWEESGEQE